ncbi:hypothetical protein WA026_003004 [Henosepilachna vigintioctopunctata]|uniref:Uncharacterized protein n=1 Tax=Henosepilachna vigintioctopunctata TaxID=420089 RepID=A0AAW1THU3_9CUCU
MSNSHYISSFAAVSWNQHEGGKIWQVMDQKGKFHVPDATVKTQSHGPLRRLRNLPWTSGTGDEKEKDLSLPTSCVQLPRASCTSVSPELFA